MKLTIGYITARKESCAHWMIESLELQRRRGDDIKVIEVDLNCSAPAIGSSDFLMLTPPKPTVWQGPHRLTKNDWWAASNARNTAICLCKTEWIAFLDDRCVLLPGWLDAIRDAQKNGYVLYGAYEKRTGMTVEGGVIKHGGTITGQDEREAKYRAEQAQFGTKGAVKCPGCWSFGCNLAVPIEACLLVNGFDETCDGLGMEDTMFGTMLENNGVPTCYNPDMKMIEDRTSIFHEHVRHEDKGKSPEDKSHALLAMLRDLKRAMHPWDLRQVRNDVLAGKPFPIPTEPTRDWYDGQPLSEFV